MYISTEKIAEKWGLSDRRVRILCNEGRIPGAIKKGKQWLIPENAERITGRQNFTEQKHICIVVVGPMGPGIEISKYLLQLNKKVCIITRDEKVKELVKTSLGDNLASKAIILQGCLYDEPFLDEVCEAIQGCVIEQIYFTEILAIFAPAEENNLQTINSILNYHTKGFILSCAKFYPQMDKTKIIFCIPKRAAFKGLVDQTLWSCAWSGVVGFTESLRAACAVGETFEVINVYHGAILSEFWKMDALGMPVEIPVNFINPKDFAQLVVDTVNRETTARVSELHFERLGVWKK